MDVRHEPSSLFHGFDGGRVADSGTPGSAGAAGWPARQVIPPGGGECHPVRAAHRLCLASVASRPACLAIGLPLLLGLAASWDLAGDSRRAALHDAAVPGPPAQPQRGHHRQPVGADHGERGPRGYDAGQQVQGRKRHIVVDTQGLLLAVAVHPADVPDRDGAKLVISKLTGRFPRLSLIWADGGYAGKLIEWMATLAGWTLAIARRPGNRHSFEVLPRR